MRHQIMPGKKEKNFVGIGLLSFRQKTMQISTLVRPICVWSTRRRSDQYNIVFAYRWLGPIHYFQSSSSLTFSSNLYIQQLAFFIGAVRITQKKVSLAPRTRNFADANSSKKNLAKTGVHVTYFSHQTQSSRRQDQRWYSF